jgi:hypothetical protein
MIRHYTATAQSYSATLFFLIFELLFFLLNKNWGRCFLPFNSRLLKTIILCHETHDSTYEKDVLLKALQVKRKQPRNMNQVAANDFKIIKRKFPFVRIGVADETSGIQFSSKELRWYV